MGTDAVRVGVIGTGFGRAVHIPALRRVSGAEIVGVASADPRRARQVAEECSVPRAFGSWEEMVQSADVDAVTIATPPSSHARIAIAAAAAGKSVFCEKPLALNAGEAASMLAAVRAAGVAHAVAFEFREIPAFRVAHDWLAGGEAGTLRHVNVRWIVGSWSDPTREWSWRAEGGQGAGALSALGVHVFDYVEWLFGPVRAVAARARTSIASRPDAGHARAVTAEDCCDLLMELADGTPVSVQLSMVGAQGRGHWIEAHGARKMLTLGSADVRDYAKGFEAREGERGKADDRTLPGSAGGDRDDEDGRIAPMAALMQRFVTAVRNGLADIRPSFEEGARAQLLLDAAEQASRERRWIDLPAPAGLEVMR